MKKIVSFALALLFVLSLSGCAGASEGKQNPPQNNLDGQVTGDITLLRCQFVDEVRAADGEAASILYTNVDGKVYVDLLFAVDNNTTKQINKNSISGWLNYQDVKIELQYCKNSANALAVNEDSVLPDEYAYIHLFTRLDAGAEKEALTVHYTVDGKEYECKVNAKNTQSPLSEKTQIKTGDSIDVPYTAYSFEVLSVGAVENLQLPNQGDTYYIGPFALVKLAVTNNHSTRAIGVNDIIAYIEEDDSYTRISVDLENEGGTDFSGNDLNIAPGKSGTVYVYIKTTGLDMDKQVIRINIAGSCYYAVVE